MSVPLQIVIDEDSGLTVIARRYRYNRALSLVTSLELWNGDALHSDELKIGDAKARAKFVKELVEKSEVELDPAKLEKQLLQLQASIHDKLREEKPQSSGAKEIAEPKEEIMDDAPAVLRRPLEIIEGTAYAATWVHKRRTTEQKLDDKGNVITYGNPLVESARVLWIVSETGEIYGELGTKKLADLPVQHGLKAMPVVSDDKLWSAAGVRRFKNGERPEAGDVFRRIVATIDRFIDFDHSLADQQTMCEFLACSILSTWFLDAFNVTGYIWPNGEKGSGKTQLLNVIAELAYLGQVILAGGTYSTLRDLADAGATLCFDEAENIANSNQPDDDKKALLLAGNRRGSSVTFKEPTPDGKAWQIRFVNTFSARAFAAINMPNGALEDRTVVIPLIRSIDRFRGNADVLDYSKWPHDKRRLLDDLFTLALIHLRELKASDEYVADNARLTGRNLEPFRSPLAVAHWLTTKGVAGLYAKLEQLSVDYQSERRGFDAGDLRVLILRALVELTGCDVCDVCDVLLRGTLREDIIKTSDIKDIVVSLAETEEIFAKTDWINPRKIGKTLQKMRFTQKRLAGTGTRAWRIEYDDLLKWKKSLSISGDTLKQTSQTSQTSHLFDNLNPDNIKLCDVCGRQNVTPETVTFETSQSETETPRLPSGDQTTEEF